MILRALFTKSRGFWGLWLVGLSQIASAEDFSLTAAKFLYGDNFHDPYYDTDARDGRMSTIQLQHFGKWRYGENYFEADLYQGDFVTAGGPQVSTGSAARIYAKWSSRLSIGKIFESPQSQEPLHFGIFRDLFFAARIDRQGNGFYGNLVGVGVDLMTSTALTIGTNLYIRKDKFNSTTYQVSPFWYIPFQIGGIKFLTNGYVDIAGTDQVGADLSTAPELLWVAGSAILIGVDVSYHSNQSIHVLAPQAEVRWIF